MEYSINIADIITIAKRNIKVVVVFALIFAMLAGGYGIMSVKRQALSPEEEQALKNQSDIYNEYSAKSPEIIESLQQKLTKAYDVIQNNPVMKIDPMNAESRVLTFTLDDGSEVFRTFTISSWIDNLSAKELFGSNNKILKQYRKEIVNVYGNNGEVNISVISNPLYDYNAVAKRIERVVKQKAGKEGVKIIGTENVKVKGFNQGIVDRQDIINNNAVRITNELNSLQNYKMEAPDEASESRSKKLLKLFIFAIAGFIFGALIGITVLSFNIIRKGIVLSADHVEDFFGIEKLGEGSIDDNNYSRVIDAVVGAIDPDIDNVMIVSREMNMKDLLRR